MATPDGSINATQVNQLQLSGGTYAGGISNSYGFGASRFGSADIPTMSFFRNRVYDQESGRFTQEDPIGMGGGLNLYQYSGNNPVAYTDPFGLCPIWVDGVPCVSPFAGSGELVAANGPPPSGRRGSEFGITRFSGLGSGRDVMHTGLDAVAPMGTGIRAPAGAVATIGRDEKSGLYVHLNLGNGYSVSFAHLSGVPAAFKDAEGNVDFSASTRVNAGDVVGYVGVSGNAERSGREPHVHIRTKENKEDINPRAFYSQLPW